MAIRVLHGYGNTHSVSKMGNTGTGMVLDFGTPRHTIPIPRCHGYSRVKYILNVLIYIYYYYFSSYCLFNIRRCEFRAEFETPRNVVRSDHFHFHPPLTTTPSPSNALACTHLTLSHCHLAPSAQNEAQAATRNKRKQQWRRTTANVRSGAGGRAPASVQRGRVTNEGQTGAGEWVVATSHHCHLVWQT